MKGIKPLLNPMRVSFLVLVSLGLFIWQEQKNKEKL
jgi:hypothetical protein